MIARVALREPDLPPMDAAHLDADLKLLVDARDQLVQEQHGCGTGCTRYC